MPAIEEFLQQAIEELSVRRALTVGGVEMTQKVQGMPNLLSGVVDRLNKAADAAVARLLAAEEANMAPVRKIHDVAGELEKNATRTQQQIDDMVNRMSNGGPPLDETTLEKPSDASAGAEADRPLGQS